MKKKLGIIFFIFFISLIVVSYEPDEVEAKKGTCTVTNDYYFMEAEVANRFDNSPDGEGWETTFLPLEANSKILDIKVKDFRTEFSGQDYENYRNIINQRQSENIDERIAYCYEGGCLNSRVEELTYITINEQEIEDLGGYDSFVDNYMITSYDADVYPVTNSDGSLKINDDGTVSVIVDRDWNLSTKEQAGGYYNEEKDKYILFFPIVATIEMTYECEVEEEKNACDAGSDKGGGISASCSGGGTSGKYVDTLTSQPYSVNFSNETNKKYCGDYTPMRTASASVIFYQTGTLSARITKEQYAGGGINFTLNYNNKAYWNYCDSSNPHASCTTLEFEPSCEARKGWTSDGFNSRTGKCEYHKKVTTDKTRHNTTVEWCDRRDGRFTNGTCYYEVEDTIEDKTDYICTQGSYGGCTGGVGGSNEAAQAEADEKINEQAGTKYKGLSIDGTVEARDSNNATDTSMHDIINEYGAGSLSGGGGGSGSWSPGSVRSASMSYIPNKACINIYTTDVRYITNDSSCTEDEIDGGKLYYIPLKMKDWEKFPIEVSVSNVSTLSYDTWPLSYKCDVHCQQRLYGNNKFVYRPIDLRPYNADDKKLSVFPKNKKPSLNWEYFWSDNSRVEKEMTREPLEYHGILSQTAINSIKNYNVYGYSDLKTISRSGKSTILDGLGIEWVNNKDFVEYNELGKCEKDCW